MPDGMETHEEAEESGRNQAAYAQIIEHIFLRKYTTEALTVAFERDDINRAAIALHLSPPSNVGDVVYTFRYRRQLPSSIRTKAPQGFEWIIRGEGDALYRFVI